MTPTLNAGRFLERCLLAIWNEQARTRVALDHVIVDGGSSDETLEIAHRYPSRVISAAAEGMYSAINTGLEEVGGSAIASINADDELAPGALDRVLRGFAGPETQWLHGGVEFIDEEGWALATLSPMSLGVRGFVGMGWSCIHSVTVWMRREFLERVGPFDASLRLCSDYDWYARALELSRPAIVKGILGRYRLHGGNLSSDLDRAAQEVREIRARYGGDRLGSLLLGRVLSVRLNLANPGWLMAKKRGRITYWAR